MFPLAKPILQYILVAAVFYSELLLQAFTYVCASLLSTCGRAVVSNPTNNYIKLTSLKKAAASSTVSL